MVTSSNINQETSLITSKGFSTFLCAKKRKRKKQTIEAFHEWISIGNSMICSDIWHKYHKWYFKIVIRNLRQFWNITSGIYAKYHVQIMLLFVYTTTRNSFVIFTCSYFKLSWNNTALSQSNCRNFSCSGINRFT